MDETSSVRRIELSTEFYLPATFQFGRGPGRIERFLRARLGSRDTGVRVVTSEDADRLSLPATAR